MKRLLGKDNLPEKFILVHNQTYGFGADLLESIKGWLGIPTEIERFTAAVVAQQLATHGSVQLVGHSQGGIIIESAVRNLSRNGVHFGLGGYSVNITTYGGGENFARASRLYHSMGMGVNDYTPYYNSGDLVPMVGGLNGNPLEMIFSIIMFPYIGAEGGGGNRSANPHNYAPGGIWPIHKK